MAGYDRTRARRVHNCPGDGCQVCVDAITQAELERDFPEESDDPGGDAQYERYLDSLGGSR